MTMTAEILNIINAVVDYKRFICSNNYIFPEVDFDWYKKTEKYFYQLPLPDGMNHNTKTFEKILAYGRDNTLLNTLNDAENDELCEYSF